MGVGRLFVWLFAPVADVPCASYSVFVARVVKNKNNLYTLIYNVDVVARASYVA